MLRPGRLCLPAAMRLAAVAAVAVLCGLPWLCAAQSCSTFTNSSCEKCLKNVTCLWCSTDNRCMDYPVTRILPRAEDCNLSAARWGVCWVNFEALIIAMSVVGGIILLGLATCCYCCCCRSRSSGPTHEDEHLFRQQEERRAQSEERRADRKARHDEIRKKYGLIKDDHAYSRLSNA